MFDLEQSIAEWRKQMLAAGIKTPVPLEELEIHLREEIEEEVQSGASEELAFKNAVQRMGHANELNVEFKTAGGTKNCRSWKLLRMGMIGLAGTPVLNLMGLFVFHRSSSTFFSDQWWSAWFPCYAIWTTFTIIGLADWMWNRKETSH